MSEVNSKTIVVGAVIVAGVVAAAIMLRTPPADTPPSTDPTSVAKAPGDKPVQVADSDKPKPVDDKPKPTVDKPVAAPVKADPKIDPSTTDDALAGLDYREATADEMVAAGVPKKLQGGVFISRVDPRSSAAEARIEAGDVITRAQDTLIKTQEDFEEAVRKRKHTLVTVYRGGKPYQVVLHRPFTADAAP